MTRDRFRQGANVLFAGTQIAAGYFAAVTGMGESIADRSAAATTPVTPAGYAFAIWGVIFAGCLAYAVYQALPRHREDRFLRRVGWFTAAAFLGNTLWGVECQLYGFTWLTVVIIVGTLAASGLACRELAPVRRALTSTEYWCVFVPVNLLAGWLSVAAFANIAAACQAHGLGSLGLSATNFAIVLIAAAGLFGVAVTVRTQGRWYAAAVVWGLIGIMVANQAADNPVVVLTAGGVAVVVLAGLYAGQFLEWTHAGQRSGRRTVVAYSSPVTSPNRP